MTDIKTPGETKHTTRYTMKTAAVDGSDKTPNMSGLLIFLLVIASAISSGCIDKQEGVKIDLDRTEEGVVQVLENDTDVVYFGFDLQPGPKEDARIYAPFLQYLSEETGRTFKIHFTSEYETTQDNFGCGITQFAALGALSHIKAHDGCGAICLVRGLNAQGRCEYRAAIVTRPDSDIKELEDIRGRTFCFGSFHSTQGHLIPRKMLEDANITPSDLGQYEYAGSHMDCAMAVIAGECDAGGLQDTMASALADAGKLTIVSFSDYYPSSGISANKDIDPVLLEAVKKALLDFDPKGKHAGNLTDWDKTEMPCGFVEADDSGYAELIGLATRYGMVEQGVVE
jgi:phosphonate transport system substrate-binding protein